MESIYLQRHTLEEIQDIQALYPGPYTVYHYETFPITELYKHGFKMGATSNIELRHQDLERHVGKKLSLPKVILETYDLLQAAEKEREIGLELGIQGDIDYIKDLKRQHSLCRKEIRRKAVESTDWELMSKKAKGRSNPKNRAHNLGKKRTKEWAANIKKGQLASVKGNKKAVLQYTMDGVFIKEYKSGAEAQRVTGAGTVIRAAKGHITHSGGFKWEFANKKD